MVVKAPAVCSLCQSLQSLLEQFDLVPHGPAPAPGRYLPFPAVGDEGMKLEVVQLLKRGVVSRRATVV